MRIKSHESPIAWLMRITDRLVTLSFFQHSISTSVMTCHTRHLPTSKHDTFRIACNFLQKVIYSSSISLDNKWHIPQHTYTSSSTFVNCWLSFALKENYHRYTNSRCETKGEAGMIYYLITLSNVNCEEKRLSDIHLTRDIHRKAEVAKVVMVDLHIHRTEV